MRNSVISVNSAVVPDGAVIAVAVVVVAAAAAAVVVAIDVASAVVERFEDQRN